MKRILALLVIAAATAVGGFASSISYYQDLGLQTLNVTNAPLNFQQFDPSLGTLLSVTLTILTSYDGNQTEVISTGNLHDYDNGGTSNLDVNMQATYSFSGYITPTAFALVAPIYGPLGTMNYAAEISWTPAQDANGDTPGTIAILGLSKSKTLSSGLGAFIGTGTVTATSVTIGGNYSGVLPTTFEQSADTQADLVGEITYNYTSDTPEPATMALFGSALIGLGVLRRRRKA